MISDLAFQSQFLALHAAFEGARAGTAGRSLAVVSLEVRRLCQRCSACAKELKALLDDGPAADLQRIAKTDTALRHLVDAIQRVTDMIAVVSATQAEERSRPRNAELAARQRQTLLIAQLASVTRTLDARAKLIMRAMQALRHHTETRRPTPPRAHPSPAGLGSSGTQPDSSL